MTTSSKKNRKQKTSPELKLWGIVLAVLLMFVVGIFFSGCKPKQQLTVNSQQLTASSEQSIEKDKLTPVSVPGDSSHIKALFRCDSLNNVLMVGLSEQKSKNMNSSFSFSNGELNYKAQTEPDTVWIKSTDRWLTKKLFRTLTITKTIVVNTPIKHGFLWWSGLLFWITLIAFILYKFVPKAPILKLINSIFKH